MNTRVYARTNSRASHAQATPRTPSMRACSILHRLRFPRVHLTCNTTCARGQPRARRTSGGAVSEALGGNSAAEGLIDGPVVGRHGDRRGGENEEARGESRSHPGTNRRNLFQDRFDSPVSVQEIANHQGNLSSFSKLMVQKRPVY